MQPGVFLLFYTKKCIGIKGEKVDGSNLDLFAFITKPQSEDKPDRKAHFLTESKQMGKMDNSQDL